jgi:hypothetical protein
MNDLGHGTSGKSRLWIILILVIIATIAMGAGTAFAGFCWAG